MRDILIIIPTRSSGGTRIESIKRLFKSWRETTDGYSDILVCMDDDDYQQYIQILPPTSIIQIRSNMKLVEKLNIAAMNYADRYKIVCFVGDDVVFKTEGWEKEVVEWMEKNKPGVCYCNDLLQEETLPNNVFLSSEIVLAMGYMVPSSIQHYYIDNFWKDLGIRLSKLKYFPDIIIEHMHWSNDKAEKDALYTESEKMMETDRQAFDKYRVQKMAEDIEKIKNYSHDSKGTEGALD